MKGRGTTTPRRYATYYRKVVRAHVRDVLLDVPGVYRGYVKRCVYTLACDHERVTGHTRYEHRARLWCTECCRLKLNGKTP